MGHNNNTPVIKLDSKAGQMENEILQVNDQLANSFIEANTQPILLPELRDKHIIPVFVKDNEPLISQTDFIDTTLKVACEVFKGERILSPSIRISHPVKGRIPEAKNKAANMLLETEKTLFYERMAFVCVISSVNTIIGNSPLSLCIGGVKAYNLDNLSNRKGTDEHFKVFIGFQNKLCTNLCIWTDGLKSDLRVGSREELEMSIRVLFQSFKFDKQLDQMKSFSNLSLNEAQFAHLIGRCRMYRFLSNELKMDIQPMTFGDSQINQVCKDYYSDVSFCKDADGNINLWNLYNLLTGSNKSSYIDTFLDRSVNAFDFTNGLRRALVSKEQNWFLN